ncbi:hypothetical protein C5167_010656 [Papaver somniferum]|uniref:BHLH domain-containing protein n=1 Tax=Papaver somniferum TaxID=3469 RepID=A0A4Y7K3Q1_PAPSO|nr:transcription factor bHLH68-like [Papaver somniferum]RZC66970.1 hypothetical protein C5167_010656 [Papaver somniferum]
MGTNESFDHEDSLSSYSQLLDSTSQDMEQSFMYSTFHSSPKPPTMLCFGNVNNNNTSISSINNNKKKLDEELGFVDRGNKVIQKSGITGGSDSSSASSSNNSSSSNSITKSKRGQIGNLRQTEQEDRESGYGSNNPIPIPGLGSSTNSQTTKRTTTTTTNKKPKKETPPSVGAPVKVRKEKIGERIAALQQLVSPFGKTDTASVLHEAMGYIRFLHDQVQVLSSPYLQKLPLSGPFAEGGRRAAAGIGTGLKTRGLCLVPIEYTLHVANCNGADLWSPAAAMGNIKNAN